MTPAIIGDYSDNVGAPHKEYAALPLPFNRVLISLGSWGSPKSYSIEGLGVSGPHVAAGIRPRL